MALTTRTSFLLVLSSSFQKNKTFLFLLPVIITLLLSSGCRTHAIWDFPINEFRQRLKSSQYDFLTSVDFENRSPKEVFSLGPGAAYYLALIFQELGRQENSLELIKLQARGKKGIWSEESRLFLLEKLLENESYAEAESLAKVYSRAARSPSFKALIHLMYIEALYWQKKDREVIVHLKKNFSEIYSHLDDERHKSEIALIKAVSTCRLEAEGWTRLFETLFTEQKSSEIHIRAYRFLKLIPERLNRFSPAYRDLIEGKYFLAGGEREKGIDLLERGLSRIDPAALAASPIIKELGFAYRYSDQYSRGSQYLADLASRLPLDKKLEAQEMSGRLDRKAGSYGKAYEKLKKTALSTEDILQRDRCLWFCLDIRLEASPEKALEEIRQNVPLWHNASYFDDLLEEIITLLAAEGNNEGLASLAEMLDGKASPAIQRRLAFILLVDGQVPFPPSGEWDPEKGTDSSPFNLKPVAQKYYELLLAGLSDSMRTELIRGEASDDKTDGEEGNSHNLLAEGFLEFGLYKRAFQYILANTEYLSDDTLLTGARLLRDRGFTNEAMRVITAYLARQTLQPSRDEAMIAFPRGFRELIEPLAKEEDIPPFLLYALVREESYFNPESESSAGARGLMQLMPVTAEETARLLKIDKTDLSDPETNLRLGAYHLGRLYRRLENIPKTLMAYNAGLSRVRSWEDQYGDLANELLVEVLPYAETRHYVRKIFVSSVFYGFLYEGKEPGEILRFFYPDLIRQSTSDLQPAFLSE